MRNKVPLRLFVPTGDLGTTMTDKPTQCHPRQPLVLPPNFRDVTAEKIGTVIGIIGATAAKATKPG
jgi:hypothetical protein